MLLAPSDDASVEVAALELASAMLLLPNVDEAGTELASGILLLPNVDEAGADDSPTMLL